MSAGPIGAGAPLRALVRQLEGTEWADPQELAASQFRHLARLSAYAAAQSPYFAQRLARAGLRTADLASAAALALLPRLTRRDIQATGADLFCRSVPGGHGAVFENRTSGSSGEPVVVRRTEVSALFWRAMAMRDIRWHGRDVTGPLCVVRANIATPQSFDSWGWPASLFGRTGPLLLLPIATDTPRLIEQLIEFAPTSLVVYPSTLAACLDYCEARDIRFDTLQHIVTVSETLPPATRARAEALLGAHIADVYSSEEAGYIALECPEGTGYHVAAESLIVEVVDDAGQPCRTGEVGRVVITDLHNYATPLVRYEVGDLAEVGDGCRCGRGLPTLRRVLGRERNLLMLPDGRRHWPVTGMLRSRDVAPVVQFQLVQTAIDAIEVRLVTERPLLATEEAALRSLLWEALGYPFTLRFQYFSGRIPAGRSGKYEEFICDVPDASIGTLVHA